MAKGFKVEPKLLEASAKVVDDKTAKYEQEVKNIYSAIQDLTVEWKGQTSDAFNKQLNEYRNDFDELAKILKGYSDSLRKSAQKYSSTDGKLAGDAQKLKIGK